MTLESIDLTVRAMTSSEMEEWIKFKGQEFLEHAGVQKNQFVLDFGCRHGTYTIPAALIVGKQGKIYAVDKRKEPLDELTRRTKKRGLKNIDAMLFSENFPLPFDDRHIDTVLLYDVIHLVTDRKILLNEIHRILKTRGILSVYSKHHQENMNMSLEEVKEEIESVGFHFEKKIFKKIMHDDHLIKDQVLIFSKFYNNEVGI